MKAVHERYVQQWLATVGPAAPLLLAGLSGQEQEEYIHAIAQQFNLADTLSLMTDKTTISIEAVRGVLNQLNRRAYGKRLVSIPAAEKLSLPAVNALLKATEEPAKTTRWLFMSQFPRQIVATLRSRCHILSLTADRDHAPVLHWNPNLLPRLSELQNKPPLTNEELAQLAAALSERLRLDGPTPALKRAFYRLRDYHKIRSHRGNEKLARDILVASLP